ncbi:MAG: phosphonate C-P lyase system protein PhnL, partial [Burkholderiaceae bacterium]
GAGKSTLLRCLYGNYRAGGGSVRVRGDAGAPWVDLAAAAPREVHALRERTLGFVTQFLRAIPRVPALDLVAEPLIAQGVDPQAAREEAKSWLSRLRIGPRLWQVPPATFSGGEQQRVNIARTMISRYPVLLLDEPTASLDDANRATVIGMIAAARERGAAIGGIFHDEPVRRAVATRLFPLSPAQPASLAALP